MRRMLWYLIAGTRGGVNRAKIINCLNQRMYALFDRLQCLRHRCQRSGLHIGGRDTWQTQRRTSQQSHDKTMPGTAANHAIPARHPHGHSSGAQSEILLSAHCPHIDRRHDHRQGHAGNGGIHDHRPGKSASQPQTEVHRFSMDVHLCRFGLTRRPRPHTDSYAGSGRRFCRVIGWFAYSSDHA